MMTSGKRTLTALFVSLAATVSGLAVNYFHYLKEGYLLLAHTMYGGEITVQSGFGLSFTHIYTMEPGGRDSLSLRFDPLNFLITFAVIFGIVLLAGLLFRKKGQREKN